MTLHLYEAKLSVVRCYRECGYIEEANRAAKEAVMLWQSMLAFNPLEHEQTR